MSQRMNGATGFFHSTTATWVPPYAWYDGAAHQEHENVDLSEVVETEQEEIDDSTPLEDLSEVVETEQEEIDDSTPLEDLSLNKLKQMAKAKGIEGWSTKEKPELVELLKVADSE